MPLYNTIGHNYAAYRRPDPRIAAAIHTALGDAATVLNVGAGAGSYEPRDRTVLAVEPSEVMIRQRPAAAAPCRQGSAESLPVESSSVDAAMAILSAHHWGNLEQGLREMVRVTRNRVVLLTWVPDAAPFWLTEHYFPEIMAYDRTVFPTTPALAAMLQRIVGPTHITPVPIPHDCIDGFLCAYWRRPECYLDADRRSAISSFARIDPEPGLEKLRSDLFSGRWMERHRPLLTLDALDVGYRIVRAEVARTNR